MKEFVLPKDITYEEVMLLELVKKNMLKKLSDRRKFIFVYLYDLGKSQREVAEVLGVNETSISHHIKGIRDILAPFKYKK